MNLSEQMDEEVKLDGEFKLDYEKTDVENNNDTIEKILKQINENYEKEKYTYEKYIDDKNKNKIYRNILIYGSLAISGCIAIIGIYFFISNSK